MNGRDSPDPGARTETWRPRFGPLCIVMVLIAAVAGLVGFLAGIELRFERIERIDAVRVMAILAVLLGLAPLIAWALTRVFPTRIGPTGVHSYNFWGLYRTLPWRDITRVTRVRFPGMPYLLVRDDKANSLYIPLFLKEPESFRQRVNALAGGDNPLARELNAHGG